MTEAELAEIRAALEAAYEAGEAKALAAWGAALKEADAYGPVVHSYPSKGSGDIMPCCGKTPFDIPRWHRLSTKPELVNCDRMKLLAEIDRLRGVVEALERKNMAQREARRVLRDQSVIVAEDGVVFEQIAKWAKVPSNTASAALEGGDG